VHMLTAEEYAEATDGKDKADVMTDAAAVWDLKTEAAAVWGLTLLVYDAQGWYHDRSSTLSLRYHDRSSTTEAVP
jgi:hypothetical protein